MSLGLVIIPYKPTGLGNQLFIRDVLKMVIIYQQQTIPVLKDTLNDFNLILDDFIRHWDTPSSH